MAYENKKSNGYPDKEDNAGLNAEEPKEGLS